MTLLSEARGNLEGVGGGVDELVTIVSCEKRLPVANQLG